jgi:hypothetical protein
MFNTINEDGHASANNDAKTFVVTTQPGFALMYLVQAFEKFTLKDLKTPTSSGCNM